MERVFLSTIIYVPNFVASIFRELPIYHRYMAYIRFIFVLYFGPLPSKNPSCAPEYGVFWVGAFENVDRFEPTYYFWSLCLGKVMTVNIRIWHLNVECNVFVECLLRYHSTGIYSYNLYIEKAQISKIQISVLQKFQPYAHCDIELNICCRYCKYYFGNITS